MSHVRRMIFVGFTIFLGLAANAAYSATPNFSGTWERYPDPYGEDYFAEDPPAPEGGPQLKEPYASEYKNLLERIAEARKQGKPLSDAHTQCAPEGMPTVMAAVEPIEIFQTPRQLVILAEFLSQTRRIYLNEKMPALDDISPGYSGYSVAHWQGQTLVVQTTGVREDVQFVSIPHSAKMKITERLRLTSPDLLENQITIDDPTTLVKPYTFTFGYKRNHDFRFAEYICDNNRFLPDAQGNAVMDLTPR